MLSHIPDLILLPILYQICFTSVFSSSSQLWKVTALAVSGSERNVGNYGVWRVSENQRGTQSLYLRICFCNFILYHMYTAEKGT